jgi:outer membrane receptor protein involved in Fe transport
MFGLTASQRYRAFLLSLDVNHTGDYISRVFPVDLTFEGHTKVDLFLSYEKLLNDRVVMTLFGGAENILDQEYFENGFRAPGAMGRGGVKVRF